MNAKEQAEKILETARRYGFEVSTRGSILTVSKRIRGEAEFAEADMMVGSVLECLPRTSAGSDWGTDGGSLGGLAALHTGRFVMNRSGGSKRVLKALASML